MEEKIDLGPVYLRPITMDDTERIVGWRNSDRVRKKFYFPEAFYRTGPHRVDGNEGGFRGSGSVHSV